MRLLALALLPLLLLPTSALAGEGQEGPSAAALAWARDTVREKLPDAVRVEAFPTGRTWLNVRRPLTWKGDLAGKVVVLDFWCYCCINCMHVLPDLAFLEHKYAGQPFAVVGVHSAKFANEKDAAHVREAVLRYGIHHPVVNDADFAIWRSFGAHSWPTFAVVAPDGRLLGVLSGEGHREDLDALVQALLEHFRSVAPESLDAKPLPIRLESSLRVPGMLSYPGKVCADAGRGSLFVADSGHDRVVEVGFDGRFKRAFGSGKPGLEDGPAGTARFHRPHGLAVHAGALWVCDTENHAIRRVDLATGTVSTVAGTGTKGDPWALVRPRGKAARHGPWPGRATALDSPWDIVFLGDRAWIAMAGAHSLWTLDPASGEVRHAAGDLTERRLDARDPYAAAFAQPSGLTTDGKVLYVADSESSSILRVVPGGAVETLAGATDDPRDLFHFGDEDGVGPGRRFQHPLGVLYRDGLLYVADSYNHKVKVLDPKTRAVHSRWGTGSAGREDGPTGAFSEPGGLAFHAGVLYVADTNNHAIRTIDLAHGQVGTLPLSGVPIPQAHARGGLSAAWPDLSGTVHPPVVEAPARLGEALPLVLELSLPAGWHLTEDAPAALRVETAGDLRRAHGRVVDVPVRGLTTKASIPAPTKTGVQDVTVRLLYYVCRDEGQCRIRSVTYTLRLAVGAGDAPVAPVTIRDAFLP
jgi:DNA-binding beta-propeller fold protein YncE